jgi:Protein of unknown function (DUF1416)
MREWLLRIRLLAPAVLGLVLLLAAGGCGEKTSKVEGTVKFKGAPVEGAMVQLLDETGKSVGQGITDPSGKYRVSTGQGKDAIPHGTYKVTVTKTETPAGSAAAGPMTAGEGPPGKEMIEMMKKTSSKKKEAQPKTKSHLPERFGNVKSTTLSISVPSENYDLDLGN